MSRAATTLSSQLLISCSRYNLKQRLDGDEVISENAFERLIEDFADNLSLSASSEDESDQEDNSDTEEDNVDKRTKGMSYVYVV